MGILCATRSWVANSHVPGVAGTPQGSILVKIDADWAGDIKDRRRYFGTVVWTKGGTEDTWYRVHAACKKQNMVCLSSGASELMAPGGGACEGPPREISGAKCAVAQLELLSSALTVQQHCASLKRKGAS